MIVKLVPLWVVDDQRESSNRQLEMRLEAKQRAAFQQALSAPVKAHHMNYL